MANNYADVFYIYIWISKLLLAFTFQTMQAAVNVSNALAIIGHCNTYWCLSILASVMALKLNQRRTA